MDAAQEESKKGDCMSKRTIVAFCGAAGSGKDEAGRSLSKLGFKKRSFAEALRREVDKAFTCPGYRVKVWDSLPECVMNAFLDCMIAGDINPWAKPTSPRMRRLLQVWGTEFRRAQEENYWVKKEIESLPERGSLLHRPAVPERR